jgi:Uma2 family endonuclease
MTQTRQTNAGESMMAATALLENAELTTDIDVDRLDDKLYEIVDGQRIEKPPMSAYSVGVASRLIRKLGRFADDNESGEVVGEMLFRLPLREDAYRNRRPDVAYVSAERWPSDRPIPIKDNAWDVVPDLAIEVMSPHDLAEASFHKVLEYFQAGVRLVWVVYPEERHVFVYESPTRVQILTSGDSLDGGTVLPGFQTPLNPLFGPVTATSDGE